MSNNFGLFCFIGLPVAGKSHVAKLLAGKYGATYISSGDIARKLSTTQELKDKTAAADMFPLETELRAELSLTIDRAPTKLIFLDGFPRVADQVEYVTREFSHLTPKIITIHAGDDVTLIGRARTRSRDERDYDNVLFAKRLATAKVNISGVHEAMRKFGYIPYTILSGMDDAVVRQFEPMLDGA